MGQFFKQTFASLVGTLAAFLVIGAVGIGSLVFLITSIALQASKPTVEDKSYLVFDLSTEIRDHNPPLTLAQALSGEDVSILTLKSVIDAIDKAAQDDRIIGIFLDGRGVGIGSGYATLQEVRAALERFQDSGKKIIAYDVELSEKEYYLASIADKILLNPLGVMEFNGIVSQQTFLEGALQKYGIGVQVVRVGDYKSAVEPFTRDDFSPENRQQLETLLDDIWGEMVTTVAKSRQLPPRQLQAIANNQGLLASEDAKQAKLVDHLSYIDQVISDLREETGNNSQQENTFRQVSLTDYIDTPVSGVTAKSSNNKIALVYAEGSIVNGQGTLRDIGGEEFSKTLRKIRQDDAVKAVVLRINSPGGSATASEVILREVKLIAETKPIIVSMGDVAASGGYWIATGAKEIFAESTTITGSIGVFGVLFNLQEIANNNGITWDTVETAELADITTNTRPKTPQELAIYQKYVNQIYDLFLEKVAQSRNLPKAKVAEIAQGRVWSGEDAKTLGLVDQIGGLEAAIAYTAKQANLGEDWEVVEYPEKRTFETEILERLSGTQALDPLTLEFLKFKEELAKLHTFDDPRGIYLRLPFNGQFQ